MALQIPELYNFGNAYAGLQQQAQGSSHLANRLAGLGAQIADTISTQNMRREADALAPVIGQQYQAGLQQIMSGDVGGGLGAIYSTGAMASRNPLLARMANDASQAAGYIANNYLKGQLQNAEMGWRQTLQNERFNATSLLEKDRQGNRLAMVDARGEQRAQEQMTPDKIQSHYRQYWKNRDKTLEELTESREEETPNPDRISELQNRLIQEDATVIANGLQTVDDDGRTLLSQEEYKAILLAQKAFQEVQATGVNNEESKKVISEYNTLMKDVQKRGERLVEQAVRRLGTTAHQARVPMEGTLPSGDPNDIIPIVPPSGIQSFSTMEEAEAAGAVPGTEVIIGGRRAVKE